jgi:hypothetical protein
MTISTNTATGVKYYSSGLLDGRSVDLYVPVTNGQVVNPNGVVWPRSNGDAHDKSEAYYKLVPFNPVPFDPELFVIDDSTSGWSLNPKIGGAPIGHPQGTYEKKEIIKRRSKDELKTLVKGYADRANGDLWPQEQGYTEKLQYAKEQIAANNNLQIFRDLVARHERLLAASFANDARLNQLYAEIDAAGETGQVDFIVSEGWVNGIAQ